MQSAAARILEDDSQEQEIQSSEKQENTAASKEKKQNDKEAPKAKEPIVINVNLEDLGEEHIIPLIVVTSI